MPSVCFYFQVHQPYRLSKYSYFNNDINYFDDHANSTIMRKVADKCYIPTNRKIKELIDRYQGAFKVS